jgi:Protein of unknown function (DUF3500)
MAASGDGLVASTPDRPGAARHRGSCRQRQGPFQESLLALTHQYLDRLPEAVADQEAARVAGLALDAAHFAWAGGAERGQPHYYRVQAPRLLIEYDNVADGANHVHSVWRGPEGDFGADLLVQHYARAH